MQTIEQLKKGLLLGSTRIKIAEQLTHFPDKLFDLADTLEILDLSNNLLSELPDSFSQLKKLKILFLSNNLFTEFPAVLGSCASLEMIGFKSNQIQKIHEQSFPKKTKWLILTNNQIKELPASIGNCKYLQKLMLAGNQLTNLPKTLQACVHLQLLRISANKLTTFPHSLLYLPNLAWLAFAGNPFCYLPNTLPNILTVNWNELNILEELGQGASGVISKAMYKSDAFAKPVAVKLFKGEVTSDGLPADEMLACVLAGEHENLVKILGKISHHPEEKQGLVMQLIDDDYTNLSGPPSFETCTRDVFTNHQSFSITSIITIIQPIAAIAFQLHKKGIMHGDLYAHNILINPDCTPLFGDFGAASLYDTNNIKVAALLERIEVKAFGCLIDDLLQQVMNTQISSHAFTLLCTLRDDCMLADISSRPNFERILLYLKENFSNENNDN
ncbi:MAG: protein kinase [Chitinophagaceae bacterium]